MKQRPKILLADDEPDVLEMYRELLSQLPSQPEIHTTNSGAKALALLESEPFRVFICDLKMPKMDGLQVLAAVRRRFPQLRTVVLTSVVDEQYRSRAYAIGVDMYWQKPGAEQEIKLFLDCMESLLGHEPGTGFRGVQSKSLVDILQLECLAQSSVVLRITNGPLSGRIWITGGEVVDAETDGLEGEEAFVRILSWKSGSFETLPAEPGRKRTIFKPYNALLLETAQALDESRHPADEAAPANAVKPTPIAAVAQLEDVEFVVAARAAGTPGIESRGAENPEAKARWAQAALERFGGLGDQLAAGPLQQLEALGLQCHVGLARAGDTHLAVGWRVRLPAEAVAERTRKAAALWQL